MSDSPKFLVVTLVVLTLGISAIVPVVMHFKGKESPSTIASDGITTMTTYGSSTAPTVNGSISTLPASTNATTALVSSSISTIRPTTTQLGYSTTSTVGLPRTIYSSVLRSTSASFCRQEPCSNALYYYEALKITVSITANYDIQSNSSMETCGYLYNTTFDTTNPWRNMLQFNYGDAATDQFLLSMRLQTMNDYIVVATTFRASVTGAFTIIVQGPAVVSMSLVNATASPLPTPSFYASALTSNSLTFCRTQSCSASGLYYYQPIGFMTAAVGDYVIQSNSTMDTYGYIFPFIRRQITTSNGAWSSDDESGGNQQFLMMIHLMAMFNYTLVVTTYAPNIIGPFSVSATGDPPLTFFAL